MTKVLFKLIQVDATWNPLILHLHRQFILTKIVCIFLS